MSKNFYGQLVPIKKEEGVWMPPEKACIYFRNGKGISPKRLMDLIYEGKKLKGKVKNDHTGWYILIPYHAIEQYKNLQAA